MKTKLVNYHLCLLSSLFIECCGGYFALNVHSFHSPSLLGVDSALKQLNLTFEADDVIFTSLTGAGHSMVIFRMGALLF